MMYPVVTIVIVAVTYAEIAETGLVNYFDENSPILYPGPTKEVDYNRYNYGNILDYEEVPEQCKNQNYCTIQPKNYPQARFNSYFPGSQQYMPQQSEDVDGNRQGDPSEKDDCDSVVTFEPLYKVKSRKNEWRTVIQSPKNNFIQKVRLETCRNVGGSCFNVFPRLPNFITSCKQKYNIWELTVEGNGRPEKIKVDLPVCCQCVYRSSING